MVSFPPDDSNRSDGSGDFKAHMDELFKKQYLDLGALQRQLDQFTNAHNTTPDEEIGGFTPDQLFALTQHRWNTPGSPLKLNPNFPLKRLEAESLFFRQSRTFFLALHESGGTKATATGNLNRKFVTSMVDKVLSGKELSATLAVNKVLNEEDVWPLHIARIVAEVAGIVARTKGQFRVKKKEVSQLDDDRAGELFVRLFLAYFTRFNLGYQVFQNPPLDWLQRDAGFVFFTLQRRATDWLAIEDLPTRLLHPMTLESLEAALKDVPYLTPEHAVMDYFIRPLEKWGMLEFELEDHSYYALPVRVRTRKLFHELVTFE
jgi:hypothetical protein